VVLPVGFGGGKGNDSFDDMVPLPVPSPKAVDEDEKSRDEMELPIPFISPKGDVFVFESPRVVDFNP